MSNQVKGTYLEDLFNQIRSIYEKHGSSLFCQWSDWPTLNEFYSCRLGGDYILTDENNNFYRFANEGGEHPVMGSRMAGDDNAAFGELRQQLQLELVKEVDVASAMTYPGAKQRYWKITAKF